MVLFAVVAIAMAACRAPPEAPDETASVAQRLAEPESCTSAVIGATYGATVLPEDDPEAPWQRMVDDGPTDVQLDDGGLRIDTQGGGNLQYGRIEALGVEGTAMRLEIVFKSLIPPEDAPPFTVEPCLAQLCPPEAGERRAEFGAIALDRGIALVIDEGGYVFLTVAGVGSEAIARLDSTIARRYVIDAERDGLVRILIDDFVFEVPWEDLPPAFEDATQGFVSFGSLNSESVWHEVSYGFCVPDEVEPPPEGGPYGPGPARDRPLVEQAAAITRSGTTSW